MTGGLFLLALSHLKIVYTSEANAFHIGEGLPSLDMGLGITTTETYD